MRSSTIQDILLFERITQAATSDYQLRHGVSRLLTSREFFKKQTRKGVSSVPKAMAGTEFLTVKSFKNIVELLAGYNGLGTESEIRMYAKAAGRCFVDALQGTWWEDIRLRLKPAQEEILSSLERAASLDEQYSNLSRDQQLQTRSLGVLPHLESYKLFVFVALWKVNEEQARSTLGTMEKRGWVKRYRDGWQIPLPVLNYCAKLLQDTPSYERKQTNRWHERALKSPDYLAYVFRFRACDDFRRMWRFNLSVWETIERVLERLWRPDTASDLLFRARGNYSHLNSCDYLLLWESSKRDISTNYVAIFSLVSFVLSILMTCWLSTSPLSTLRLASIFLVMLGLVLGIYYLILGIFYCCKDLPRFYRLLP